MKRKDRDRVFRQQADGNKQREAMSIILPVDTITITIDNRTNQASMQTSRALPIPHVCLIFSQLAVQLLSQMMRQVAGQMGLVGNTPAPMPEACEARNEATNEGGNGITKP